jgi:hypothetical protein
VEDGLMTPCEAVGADQRMPSEFADMATCNCSAELMVIIRRKELW